MATKSTKPTKNDEKASTNALSRQDIATTHSQLQFLTKNFRGFRGFRGYELSRK